MNTITGGHMETEFRILDVLSREIGNSLSINKIAEKVKTVYGSGDYKNIYVAMNNMARNKVVKLEPTGNTSIASINFENYMIIDLLSELELKKKQDFLKNRQEMQMLMMEIDTYLHSFLLIKSISFMNPEKNTKLNKAELFIHLRKTDRKSMEETKRGIHAIIDTLQKIHNIRIDYMVLEDKMFLNLLRSNEHNPAKEMLSNKIVIFNPQDFWFEIKKAMEAGIKIIAEESETNPAKTSEADLVFNLTRFGYTELGPQVKQGKLICIEYVINAIMFQNDARRIDAIPVILAKNSDKTNYDLLLFLARKYGFGGKILGILKVMRNLVVHGMAMINEPIRLLEAMKMEEVKANEKSIQEKLKLYNVT